MHSCFNCNEDNNMNIRTIHNHDERLSNGRVTSCYFNLHNHHWSMQQRGLVIGHAEQLVADDCSFTVRPSGRKRVLEEGKKNVHAFAKSRHWHVSPLPDRDDAFEFYELLGYVEISYNPFKADHFYVKATGERVDHAERVILFANKRVMALNPTKD